MKFWLNMRKKASDRRIRVVANWPLRSRYPNALVEALTIISSNHAPIIFHLNLKGRSGLSFKYEAFWEGHAECKDVMAYGLQGDYDSEERTSLLNKTKNVECSFKNGIVRLSEWWMKKLLE